MVNQESLRQIYNQTLEVAAERFSISESARNLWLNKITPVKIDINDKMNVIYFTTDVPFIRDTVNNLYKTKLEEAFRDTLSIPVSIEISVTGAAEEPAPAAEIPKTVIDSYTFDTFIEGPSNNLAFAAAKAVATGQHQQYNPLFIYGNSGLGKTHLLSAIRHEMLKNNPDVKIIYIPAEKFTNDFLSSISNGTVAKFDEEYRSVDALLIDDIQFIAGKDQTEEKFFHIFNELYNRNKAIVLTADRPAKEIPSIPDRLKSRFTSGLIADIKPPEYETCLLIVKRKAELYNFHIPDDVIDFIATKVRSNIRQIEGVVTKLHALYEMNGITPTISAAQNVIRDIAAEQQPTPVTVDKIITEVGKIYNVTPEEMRSQKRVSNISNARKVAIYVIQNVTGLSYEAIGKEFNGRDHSTIVYAINNIKEKMERDSTFRSVVEDLIKNIKANQ